MQDLYNKSKFPTSAEMQHRTHLIYREQSLAVIGITSTGPTYFITRAGFPNTSEDNRKERKNTLYLVAFPVKRRFQMMDSFHSVSSGSFPVIASKLTIQGIQIIR